MKSGDVMVSLDGKKYADASAFVTAIQAHPNQAITLVVQRAGHLVTLHMTPLDGRKVKTSKNSATLDPARGTGREGSSVAEGTEATPLSASVFIERLPVTAGHIACRHALPDGAVATVSPPRVIDPGSWMPRPSPELDVTAAVGLGEAAAIVTLASTERPVETSFVLLREAVK